jgi:hypothetical protein
MSLLCLFQHTRCAFRGGNLSEKDPQQFARLLADRLRQVCDEQQLEDSVKHRDVVRDGASVRIVCKVLTVRDHYPHVTTYASSVTGCDLCLVLWG